MNTLERRIALVAGPLAVLLWVAGLLVGNSGSKIPHHPTDAQLLTWVQGNKNSITLGSFLFMAGCVVFLWFASILRARLAAAEGENHTFSTLVFGAAVVMTGLGMGMNPDILTALNSSSVLAATAGTVHNLGTLFFIGAEIALFAVLVGTAVVAFKTAILPKWWASLGALVGVVALIGPIGWLGLIFGLPLWTLGTTVFLARKPRTAAGARTAVVATAEGRDAARRPAVRPPRRLRAGSADPAGARATTRRRARPVSSRGRRARPGRLAARRAARPNPARRPAARPAAHRPSTRRAPRRRPRA